MARKETIDYSMPTEWIKKHYGITFPLWRQSKQKTPTKEQNTREPTYQAGTEGGGEAEMESLRGLEEENTETKMIS